METIHILCSMPCRIDERQDAISVLQEAKGSQTSNENPVNNEYAEINI